MTNALEDFHAAIEGKFIPLLERIKAGDTRFYFDGEEALDFISFVCTQYIRTKAIRVRTIERLKQNGLLDLTHVWNLMSYLYALNIGANYSTLCDSSSSRWLRSRRGACITIASPGKASISIVVGTYKDQSGIAIGIGYSVTDRWRVNAAFTGTP